MLNTSRRHIRPTRQSSSVAQACRSDKTRMESVQTYQLCLGKFPEFSYCQELMSWYTQKTMPPTSFQKLLFQQYSSRLPFTGIEKVHVVFGPVIISNCPMTAKLATFQRMCFSWVFRSHILCDFCRVESGHPAPNPQRGWDNVTNIVIPRGKKKPWNWYLDVQIGNFLRSMPGIVTRYPEKSTWVSYIYQPAKSRYTSPIMQIVQDILSYPKSARNQNP